MSTENLELIRRGYEAFGAWPTGGPWNSANTKATSKPRTSSGRNELMLAVLAVRRTDNAVLVVA
jgi:hypothetical protein